MHLRSYPSIVLIQSAHRKFYWKCLSFWKFYRKCISYAKWSITCYWPHKVYAPDLLHLSVSILLIMLFFLLDCPLPSAELGLLFCLSFYLTNRAQVVSVCVYIYERAFIFSFTHAHWCFEKLSAWTFSTYSMYHSPFPPHSCYRNIFKFSAHENDPSLSKSILLTLVYTLNYPWICSCVTHL